MEKFPRTGIGVIVIKQNKVLLGKRRNSHGEGHWAFPGGHLEFGETPEECAIRELAEETGLIAEHISSGPWVNSIFEGKHYVTLFMIVNQTKGTERLLEPQKCEGWEWFEVTNLPEPLFAPIKSLINYDGWNKIKNSSSLPI